MLCIIFNKQVLLGFTMFFLISKAAKMQVMLEATLLVLEN